MISFVLGMFVGACVGVLFVALCMAARSAGVRSSDALNFPWQRETPSKPYYAPELDESVLY
jgi:hypothetical protein